MLTQIAKGVYTLCEQFFNPFARHVGQPKIPALKTIREFGVIESKEMEQGRVQVVNVNFIARDVEAKVV